jgi:hypothetical protein
MVDKNTRPITVLCASLILDLSPTESDLARTRLQSGDSMVRPYLLFHYFHTYKNKISFTPPPPYRSLPIVKSGSTNPFVPGVAC